MTTFKISKFVARYDLEPIYSVDSSEKLHYVIDKLIVFQIPNQILINK